LIDSLAVLLHRPTAGDVAMGRGADGLWSRSTGARRYGRDVAGLLALKLVLLIALWMVAVDPAPHAPVDAAAVAARLGVEHQAATP
jgi:hypothetical protein